MYACVRTPTSTPPRSIVSYNKIVCSRTSIRRTLSVVPDGVRLVEVRLYMQYNDAFYRVIKTNTYFKEVNLFVFPRSIHIIFGYYFHFKQFYQPKHHVCPKYSYPNNVPLFQLLTIS